MKPHSKEQISSWVVFGLNIVTEAVAIIPLFEELDIGFHREAFVLIVVLIACDILVIFLAVLATITDPSDPVVKLERYCRLTNKSFPDSKYEYYC